MVEIDAAEIGGRARSSSKRYESRDRNWNRHAQNEDTKGTRVGEKRSGRGKTGENGRKSKGKEDRKEFEYFLKSQESFFLCRANLKRS